MNIYINNIKITLLANAGSLNVGTTLNMVKTNEATKRRFQPRDIIPALRDPDLPEKLQQEAQELIPDIPIVRG